MVCTKHGSIDANSLYSGSQRSAIERYTVEVHVALQNIA
jgi:hypothetical protein